MIFTGTRCAKRTHSRLLSIDANPLLFTVLLLLLTAAATLSTVPCMMRLLPSGVISARSPLFRPLSLVSSR
ncbi:hypothetical protein D3C72_2209520 [compost metagenome]